MLTYLVRGHQVRDWGETSREDRERNEFAVSASGNNILSVYDIEGTSFWVITEGDRSYTKIMLPEDYWFGSTIT